jgi:hypothetical protein
MSPMMSQDMSKVAKWGDNVPEGWYHVRIDKGELKDSENTPGEKVWWLYLKVQNEPFVGRVLVDFCSLQAHALAKLKGYYAAIGYEPGPEGHDPEKLNGGELYVFAQEEVYQGNKRTKVVPWGIKSMTEGPGGALAKAAS